MNVVLGCYTRTAVSLNIKSVLKKKKKKKNLFRKSHDVKLVTGSLLSQQNTITCEQNIQKVGHDQGR